MDFKIGDHVKLDKNGVFPERHLYDRQQCLDRTWEILGFTKDGSIDIREVGGSVGMFIRKEDVDRTLIKA